MGGATAPTFGGAAATGIAVVNASTISPSTPAHAPGGTGTGWGFYVASATVTSIAPTSGPTQGGTSVTIADAHFTGVMAVTFGVAATGMAVVNATTV